MPKLDVVPALDSDLRDWAMKVASFIDCPPQSAEDPHELVFQPLLSNRYSMTFRHTASAENQDIMCTGNDNAGEVKRSSGRFRRRAYHNEPETISERRLRRARENNSSTE